MDRTSCFGLRKLAKRGCSTLALIAATPLLAMPFLITPMLVMPALAAPELAISELSMSELAMSELSMPGLASAPMQEPSVIGVSVVVGLVLFSTFTALLHITGRKQWTQRERSLTAELEAAHAKLERARVFLSAEPQIIVAWGSATGEPEIEGEISLVTDAPVPRRVLGFGAWLEPALAQRLDDCIERLRARGEGFRMALVSLSGRHLEADGRAIAGRAVLRIRDVSGDRMELLSLRQKHTELGAQFEALRGLLDSIAAPVWMRDTTGRLTWVNKAYARAVEVRDGEEAIRRNIELLDAKARDASAHVRAEGGIWRERLPGLVAGARHLLDIVDVPARYGCVGIAQDLSELESVRDNLEQQMESHARTLDQLPTAVAIFDGKKRLVFHNAAYRQVWGLPQSFLDQNPSDSEILDRLRIERRLQEHADFRTWKNSILSAYHTHETREQMWYLPDGRTLRVVSNPSPHGGVTYLYDDVSERFQIESKFNALVRVQGETLDTLQEGVAVFGTDGKLKLYNPSFAALWRLDNGALSLHPHFDAIAAKSVGLCAGPENFMKIREVVTGLYEERKGYVCRIERTDGLVLDCAAQPLPDGATLLTFIDVTAQISVERALTDRNQALIEAENLRNDFVHHISYELRSPLTNIIGFIQLLNDETVGALNVRQREYVGFVMRSSAALLAIINDILDLATIDKDGMHLELAEVDVDEVMRTAAAGVQDRLSESGIHLSIAPIEGGGSFQADPKRLRQILFNLLSNAIGFSAPGQTVTLAAMRREGEIVFKVTDHGRGIPPDVLDKVFNRFESHTIGSRHRGVGLGLSIVRALVELHGGRVYIDSTLGEGATATCIFPTALQQPGQTPKPAGAPKLELVVNNPPTLQLALEEVDIGEIMGAAAQGVAKRLNETGVHLSIVPLDGLGSFQADPERIREILFNLLANAIEYSAHGQTVTLAAMRREDEIVIKATDAGRGIASDVIEAVFVGHAIGARYRSASLGLSIVRALVELHGGRIYIDSAPGEGATVTCIFPTGALQHGQSPKRADGPALEADRTLK